MIPQDFFDDSQIGHKTSGTLFLQPGNVGGFFQTEQQTAIIRNSAENCSLVSGGKKIKFSCKSYFKPRCEK